MTNEQKIAFLESLVLDLLDLAHHREFAPRRDVLDGQWKFYRERNALMDAQD